MRTLVIGLGATGLSLVRHLRRGGQDVLCVDTRAEPPGAQALARDFPEVELVCTTNWLPAFDGVELVCVSPGVAPDLPLLQAARARGIDCVGDIELFARAGVRRVVAVTGTNGKSTVVSLLGAFARAAGEDVGVGGNLMPPALDLLAEPHERWLLELSSFQLEWTESLALDVAVLLNIAPDHLDRYPDMDAYAAAKQRIFRHAAVAVVPAEDPRCWPSTAFRGEVMRVPDVDDDASQALWSVADSPSGSVLLGPDGASLPVASLRLQGTHNWRNVLFALTAGSRLGYAPEVMLSALVDFDGLPHRCELVGEIDGVRFVNDSKATNVHASVAAIQGVGAAVSGVLVLVVGGLAKEPDFSPLARACTGRVDHVLLIGRERGLLRAAFAAADIEPVDCEDLRAAVSRGRAAAAGGGVVLFSPACASFDEFDDYRARGQAFRDAVVAEGLAA